jgi:hypothetical protein
MTTLDAVRAAALFAGDLQPGQHPGPAQVRRTVTATLHRRGAGWCTARVAEEFRADPESAARRLAWALRVVRNCYARAATVPVTRCRAAYGRPGGSRLSADPGWAPRCRYPLNRYRTPGR